MKRRKNRTGLALLLLLLLLTALMGSAVGKYKKTDTKTGNVQFTAELATNLILLEHKAVKQDDGRYILDEKDTVTENSYILIPGLDIPKDPYVIIEGKSPVPAYLFVEITSTLDAPVSYEIDDANWKEIKSDGSKKVYCYTGEIGTGSINILKYKSVTVSQNLLSNYDDAQDVLTIRAILKEKHGSDTALKTYEK